MVREENVFSLFYLWTVIPIEFSESMFLFSIVACWNSDGNSVNHDQDVLIPGACLFARHNCVFLAASKQFTSRKQQQKDSVCVLSWGRVSMYLYVYLCISM